MMGSSGKTALGRACAAGGAHFCEHRNDFHRDTLVELSDGWESSVQGGRVITPGVQARQSGALRFVPTRVHGAWLVEGVQRGDERGFFARLFCAGDFAAMGLESRFAQVNTSLSRRRHTLRGMHYQLPPAAEVKLVRCTSGVLFDVVLDLRADSPSFGQWFGAELSAENRRMLYVPRGCAHGFLTLAAETEALYLVSDAYAPQRERGIRFDDPRFAIEWPAEPGEVSAKDRDWPGFDPVFHGTELLRGIA